MQTKLFPQDLRISEPNTPFLSDLRTDLLGKKIVNYITLRNSETLYGVPKVGMIEVDGQILEAMGEFNQADLYAYNDSAIHHNRPPLLHLLASNRGFDAISLPESFISEFGATLDHNGDSFLHVMLMDNPDCLQHIGYETQANMSKVYDRNGYTFIHKAAEMGLLPVVNPKVLLENARVLTKGGDSLAHLAFDYAQIPPVVLNQCGEVLTKDLNESFLHVCASVGRIDRLDPILISHAPLIEKLWDVKNAHNQAFYDYRSHRENKFHIEVLVANPKAQTTVGMALDSDGIVYKGISLSPYYKLDSVKIPKGDICCLAPGYPKQIESLLGPCLATINKNANVTMSFSPIDLEL